MAGEEYDARGDIVLKVRRSDDVIKDLLDSVGSAISVIEYEHHEVHSGNHYFVAGETMLDDEATIEFQLTAPAISVAAIHMTFDFQATSELLFEVYEAAAVGAGGAVTARNNDRNSANTTALTLIQTGGAVSTAGTLIYSARVGKAGNVNVSRSGFSTRGQEIILKALTTYRFKFTSAQAGNNVSYKGEWYEEG